MTELAQAAAGAWLTALLCVGGLAAECADVAGQAESRAALLGEQAKAAKKEAETKSKEAGKLLAVYRAKEESRCEPSIATVAQLAKVLGVEPCWLAWGIDHDK